MVPERREALPEAALRVEVREEEEEAYDEDQARYNGPLDDVARLQSVSCESVVDRRGGRTRECHQGRATPSLSRTQPLGRLSGSTSLWRG